MLKLKVHLMRRTDSLEKTLMLGKIEVGRGSGRQRMKWLDGITDSMDMSLSKLHALEKEMATTPVFLPGSLVGCRLWCHTELDTTEVT